MKHLLLFIVAIVIVAVIIVAINYVDSFYATSHIAIPRSYANISNDRLGNLYVKNPDSGKRYILKNLDPKYTINIVKGNPKGDSNGIRFTFRHPNGKPVKSLTGGKIYIGFIEENTTAYSVPIFYEYPMHINDKGTAFINIKEYLSGKYDMINWQNNGRGIIAYRLIDNKGSIVYDGKIAFKGKGPFSVDTSIVNGPFIFNVTDTSSIIEFDTNVPTVSYVTVRGKRFFGEKGVKHEIKINGLQPNTWYKYTVSTKEGLNTFTHKFKTAPAPGSKKPFIFAYASDSRTGAGGGERSIFGTNAYMIKKIMALSTSRNAAFLLFTGDMIDGYKSNIDDQRIEYTNWKNAIQPWACRTPVIAGMGNHEALHCVWDDGSKEGLNVDKFPFETQSAESLFAELFVNPENGPESEDGTEYDTNPDTIDFPSYKENVFYYIYGNIAVMMLNSNYWYSSSVHKSHRFVGGNPHGYIMDNQLKWIRETLNTLDADKNIDHIFMTIHTPAFPNGGHIHNDMWYNGTNDIRPWIDGKPVKKGIIERRDEFWQTIMKHKKVKALLTGDEHNYNRLTIKKGVDIYGDYNPNANGHKKIEITRPVSQIHNGAAGSPYASKGNPPWGNYTQNFTTQNAVVFFYVDGTALSLEVINPDTLYQIEEKTSVE